MQRISSWVPDRMRCDMLARLRISTLETTTKRPFAARGRCNEVLRKSQPGADHRPRGRDLDRGLPGLRLPPAYRRPTERHPPVAACLLRHHLDRAALLFQLRADADDAAKAKAATTATIASRLNTLLSIPMLLAMTNAH